MVILKEEFTDCLGKWEEENKKVRKVSDITILILSGGLSRHCHKQAILSLMFNSLIHDQVV